MMTKLYQGSSVGLGTLDGLDVDVLRITYTLIPLRSGRSPCGETGDYDMTALCDSEITYSRALECVEAAITVATEKMEVGHSIVCPSAGPARTEALMIHLDWHVEHYYNQSDLVTEKAFTPNDCDMYFLFSRSCRPNERIDALRLVHRKLREVGLPKGVVAIGRERYITVCETDNGHNTIEWSVG